MSQLHCTTTLSPLDFSSSIRMLPSPCEFPLLPEEVGHCAPHGFLRSYGTDARQVDITAVNSLSIMQCSSSFHLSVPCINFSGTFSSTLMTILSSSSYYPFLTQLYVLLCFECAISSWLWLALGQNPCPCAFARWQNPCPCAFSRCNIDGGDTIAQVVIRGHHRRRNVTPAEKLSRYWSRVHSWDMNVPFMN